MRRLAFALVINLFCTFSLLATGDSLRYLTPKDTVFLKADDFGGLIFGHTLEKGQTLYSLSRFYGLKVESVYAFNPAIDPAIGVSVGSVVQVPIPDSAIQKDLKMVWPRQNFVPVFYVVKHGDTFFRIAQNYFHMSIDSLKKRNKLDKTVVFSGQRLHVGWLPVSGIPDSLQASNDNPFGAKMQQLFLSYEAVKTKKKEQFHNGAAYWQREKKGDTEFYALHREAPIGSIIQITNPLKQKTVYAKVIAKIPDRAYGDDIVAVISPAIAKLLGAKDPKFFVEIKYFK